MAGTQNLTLSPLYGIEEPEVLNSHHWGIVLVWLRARQLEAKLAKTSARALQDAD